MGGEAELQQLFYLRPLRGEVGLKRERFAFSRDESPGKRVSKARAFFFIYFPLLPSFVSSSGSKGISLLPPASIWTGLACFLSLASFPPHPPWGLPKRPSPAALPCPGWSWLVERLLQILVCRMTALNLLRLAASTNGLKI